MVRKGVISTVDNTNRKARVYFPDVNSVSPELPIASFINVQVNDAVLVEFWTSNLVDGLITENLSAPPTVIPTKTSQLENDAGFVTADQIPQASTYIHQQIAPADVWTINHNLGRFPGIVIVDSAGSKVYGDIQFVSENQIQVSFTAAFAGKAYLN